MSEPGAPPRTGLARCINAPGGINMREACSRADLHLQLLRERTSGVMDDCLTGITSIIAEIDGVPSSDARQHLHQLSCSLAALGGMFGRDGLSKVAHSFCRLIDATEPGWDAAAVSVHVHAMRLLFTPERVPAATQAELIEGLIKVRSASAPP